jgi:monomeric sarcosine oxidase
LKSTAFFAILNPYPEKSQGGCEIVSQPRIAIIGAGIAGLSTAYALLKQGMKHVTVLEQATVDHRRSTSHGISRLLRFEYGADLLYTEMVRLSLSRWRNLERAARRTLYTPTGLLVIGREDDNFTRPSYYLLREAGIATERLSRRTCMQRFPQFNLLNHDMFTYNENAGILHASLCLQALKSCILDLGGNIVEGQRVLALSYDSRPRPICLRLSSGDEYYADKVVLCIGPWIHRLLGGLRLPVRLTRQYLLYFANLPLSSFKIQTFPAFISDDLYGFPIHSTCSAHGPTWLKAASHSFGATVDPDEMPAIDTRIIDQIIRKLRDLLPALQEAELAHIDACMYDVSPDEDFILDRLPEDPHIVFGTGLSGHGFKFGPLLGELLASLVCDTEPPVPMERFRMARFAHQWQDSSVA